jgi:hypothetical protein
MLSRARLRAEASYVSKPTSGAFNFGDFQLLSEMLTWNEAHLTSAASHPLNSSKGLGFAAQDCSWCAFIGEMITRSLV